jgi:hypothetical protein
MVRAKFVWRTGVVEVRQIEGGLPMALHYRLVKAGRTSEVARMLLCGGEIEVQFSEFDLRRMSNGTVAYVEREPLGYQDRCGTVVEAPTVH